MTFSFHLFSALLPCFFFFHLSLFCLSLYSVMCRKQTNLWIQGDVLRSKQQKSMVYEESSVPRLISSLDDLNISSSFLRSGSMEEVRERRTYYETTPMHSYQIAVDLLMFLLC